MSSSANFSFLYGGVFEGISGEWLEVGDGGSLSVGVRKTLFQYKG